MIMPGFPRPLAMAGGGVPVFRSSSVNFSTTNANTVSAPSGMAAGDLLVAVGFKFNAGASITLPSGWTQKALSSSNDGSMFVAEKIADGGETSFAFTWGGSGSNNVIAVLAYEGGSAVDSVGTPSAASFGNSSVAASISPTSPGVLIAASGIRTTATATPPSGMTQIASYSGSPSFSVCELTPSAAGATGTKTFTWSASDYNRAVLAQLVA